MWTWVLVSLLAAQYAFQQPKTLEKHITKRDRWPTKNTKAELAIAGKKITLTYWRGRLYTPSPAAPCQISVIHSIHQHHHSYFVKTDSSSSSSSSSIQQSSTQEKKRKSTCSLSTGTPAGTCEAMTVQLLIQATMSEKGRRRWRKKGFASSPTRQRGREREREN